jgi:hypothetical protein
MNQLLQQCADFLTENEWHFECAPDSRRLKTSFESEHARWQVVVMCDEEGDSLKFVSKFPSKVKAALLPKAAELVLRINNQIKFGSLHLDMEDGDLFFVTELFAANKSADIEDIKHLIASNLCILDGHYDTLMKVIHGGMSPKKALASAEEKKAKSNHQARFNMN